MARTHNRGIRAELDAEVRSVAAAAEMTWDQILERAACADAPNPGIFFTMEGTPEWIADSIAAKAICRRCHVRIPCLAWGTAKRGRWQEDSGIIGGRDKGERRTIGQKRLAIVANA